MIYRKVIMTAQCSHIPFTSFPLMFPPRFHWGINDKLKLYVFYQTKLGSAYLYRVKPIYWHWVVKESVRFITSAKERVCVTNAEKTLTQQWISGKNFKGRVKEGRCRCVISPDTIPWLTVRYWGGFTGTITNLQAPICLGTTCAWSSCS